MEREFELLLTIMIVTCSQHFITDICTPRCAYTHRLIQAVNRNALSTDKTWPFEGEILQLFNGMQSCTLILRSWGLATGGATRSKLVTNQDLAKPPKFIDEAVCSAQRWGEETFSFTAQLNQRISSSTISAAIWTWYWLSLDLPNTHRGFLQHGDIFSIC